MVHGDPQIFIKTPEESNPDWISPDGFNDPENAWDDEYFSLDRNLYTKAGCTIEEQGEQMTPYLELTLSSPINSDKIRFYAWYHWRHCYLIDVGVYYDGDWHNVYFDKFPSYQWVDVPFDEEHLVEKAIVRFCVKRWILWPVTADLHEFQFYQVT
jgi:hypothetical protein